MEKGGEGMNKPLERSLKQKLAWLDKNFGTSADYYSRCIEVCGVDCAIVMFDGLSSLESLWNIGLERLSRSRRFYLTGQGLMEYILNSSAIPTEPNPLKTQEDVLQKLTGGMAVLFMEDVAEGIAFSVQSMKYRSVGEPTGEGDVKGSQEGFTELLRVNIGLIRRLVRTEQLTIEIDRLGERTQTEYALCYDRAQIPAKLLAHCKQVLGGLHLPVLFDSAYLIPFLREEPFHLFAGLGSTERPVAAAAKISEGKLIVLVNGSPFALIMPYFFAENFETLDDYSDTAFFASFVRLMKYIAFVLCIYLPGLYVLAVCHTPEILPQKLLGIVAKAQAGTPLPLMLEMLLVVLLFEIIREAGLRMPKQLGHSVSLVAALIIGDTAVDVGLLSVPVIFISAMAAVSSYVVPSLYQQTAFLRTVAIVLCGALGVPGLALAVVLLICEIACQSAGYRYLYPLVPLCAESLRDGIVRRSWKKLMRRPFVLDEISRGEKT